MEYGRENVSESADNDFYYQHIVNITRLRRLLTEADLHDQSACNRRIPLASRIASNNNEYCAPYLD